MNQVSNNINAGTLYVVATPIGNLEDITLRALRVLKEADLIFAEDTRVSKKLLSHFGIKTPVARIHTRDEKRAVAAIICVLENGKNVSLVSDAGTPGVSDPGSFIISRVREELPEAKIMSVPGSSALTAALSIAGLPTSDFLFLGFLPHKKGREKLFKEIAESEHSVVFYESPHRILKTLESLKTHLGTQPPSEKKITICRELTKIHEEVVNGTPAELLGYFHNNPQKVHGEFVVIVATSSYSELILKQTKI